MEEQSEVKPKRTKRSRSFKPTAKQFYVVVAVLAVLLLVVLGVIIYNLGQSRGKKAASKNPFNLSTPLAERLKSGKDAIPIQAISGNAVRVSESEVVIEQHNKEQKTFRIDESTKINMKKEAVKAADIAAGTRVTVFARSNTGETPLATRIVIRQKSQESDN